MLTEGGLSLGLVGVPSLWRSWWGAKIVAGPIRTSYRLTRGGSRAQAETEAFHNVHTMEESGVSHVDWIALREYGGNALLLQLYIESADDTVDPASAQRGIHQSLCELDQPYADAKEMLGILPLKVAALTPGTFKRYTAVQQERGADLAHLKPPHMNPFDEQLELLLA